MIFFYDIDADPGVGGFRTSVSIAVRTQFGFSYRTTAISGVIMPADSAQARGHASSIAIPTYPWTLPVGEIDSGYRLVLSETERILPVCNHFGFYIQIERIVPRRGTN